MFVGCIFAVLGSSDHNNHFPEDSIDECFDGVWQPCKVHLTRHEARGLQSDLADWQHCRASCSHVTTSISQPRLCHPGRCVCWGEGRERQSASYLRQVNLQALISPEGTFNLMLCQHFALPLSCGFDALDMDCNLPHSPHRHIFRLNSDINGCYGFDWNLPDVHTKKWLSTYY